MKIELQNGDRIQIPDGCKATIEGNKIVIEKEEEQEEEFKDGDVLISINSDIVIFKEYIGCFAFKAYYSTDSYIDRYFNDVIFRHATDEEKKLLFDKMKEQGLKWNAEEKKVEKILWRAEIDGGYYLFTPNCNIYNSIDIRSPLDDRRYSIGNYFRTREQAEKAAVVVKGALRKFHEENE